MNLTFHQINKKIHAQSESLDMLGNQLRWILDETNKNNAEPGSPYGNEMIQRFFSLYRDFKRIQKEIIDFSEELKLMDYEDNHIGKIYYDCSLILIEKCKSGIFKQFTVVVEEGRLPD